MMGSLHGSLYGVSGISGVIPGSSFESASVSTSASGAPCSPPSAVALVSGPFCVTAFSTRRATSSTNASSTAAKFL